MAQKKSSCSGRETTSATDEFLNIASGDSFGIDKRN